MDFVMVEQGSLSLSTVAERELVSFKEHKLSVVASVLAAACDNRRPDVEVCVVLDRSGSMSGPKLDLCKKTLELLVRELRPSDSFGLVTFDEHVRVDWKLRRLEDKEQPLTAIRRVSVGGTTNLSGGLLKGLEQFPLDDETSSPEKVRAVLVLTDGHANVGITDDDKIVASANAVLPAGVSIYTFGYGSDHNADLLRSLSKVTPGGGYYFVDTVDRVTGAFADCLGGMLSVVAQNIRLHVRSEGGIVARVRREGAQRLNADHWIVDIGDQHAEERRDVLIDIEPLSSAEQVTVLFELRYLDANLAQLMSCSATVVIERTRDEQRLKEASAKTSPVVAAHVARLDVADALSNAQQVADNGDIKAAKIILQEAELKVQAVMAENSYDEPESNLLKRLALDINECSKSAASRELYSARGRHKLVSKQHGHQVQRCYEDSDSDSEDETKVRNVYRGQGSRHVKSKWTTSVEESKRKK